MRQDKQGNNEIQLSDEFVKFSWVAPNIDRSPELTNIDERYICEEESTNVIPTNPLTDGGAIKYLADNICGKTIKHISVTKNNKQFKINFDDGYIIIYAEKFHNIQIPMFWYRNY